MIVMIDAIGKRYGMLPSKVISEANTFDVFILDAAITYDNHMQEKAYKKRNPNTGDMSNQPVEDEKMLAALQKFKEGHA
jgi:hypothetical protein